MWKVGRKKTRFTHRGATFRQRDWSDKVDMEDWDDIGCTYEVVHMYMIHMYQKDSVLFRKKRACERLQPKM